MNFSLLSGALNHFIAVYEKVIIELPSGQRKQLRVFHIEVGCAVALIRTKLLKNCHAASRL